MLFAAALSNFGLAGLARAGGKNLDGVVNLNTAPPEVLSLLPGIGPSKARAILAYRARRPFRTVDELVRIKGIGRRMVRDLRPHLAIAGPSSVRALPGTYAVAPPVQPVLRPVCRPPVPVQVKPGLVRLTRSPASRPVRSRANHCAPPA